MSKYSLIPHVLYQFCKYNLLLIKFSQHYSNIFSLGFSLSGDLGRFWNVTNLIFIFRLQRRKRLPIHSAWYWDRRRNIQAWSRRINPSTWRTSSIRRCCSVWNWRRQNDNCRHSRKGRFFLISNIKNIFIGRFNLQYEVERILCNLQSSQTRAFVRCSFSWSLHFWRAKFKIVSIKMYKFILSF